MLGYLSGMESQGTLITKFRADIPFQQVDISRGLLWLLRLLPGKTTLAEPRGLENIEPLWVVTPSTNLVSDSTRIGAAGLRQSVRCVARAPGSREMGGRGRGRLGFQPQSDPRTL